MNRTQFAGPRWLHQCLPNKTGDYLVLADVNDIAIPPRPLGCPHDPSGLRVFSTVQRNQRSLPDCLYTLQRGVAIALHMPEQVVTKVDVHRRS
jgi:hypothetical protein